MESLYLDIVDSTNKWAKENFNSIKDMTVIYTYNQTAGRGRLNRSWNNTGSDNIYASIVLKPKSSIKNVYANLTQYLCVILAKTIEEYGIKTEIKWPNDIKVNGKKISGILAESVNNGTDISGIILGLGVNLNTDIENLRTIDQPATALNIETGKNIDKVEFFENLLKRFCLLYDRFIGEGFLLIKEDYKKRAYFLNKEIKIKDINGTLCGTAIDITDDGALKIRDNEGTEHILLTGDIL